MDYYARSISARTADSEPSLVLKFPTTQYLFNAGEGTQRAFGETVSTTKGLESIFLTGLSTDETGGLSGKSDAAVGPQSCGLSSDIRHCPLSSDRHDLHDG